MVMEDYMRTLVSLSEAKAHLSEVVRSVRKGGTETIITVDGEAAVRLVPVDAGPQALTPTEVATYQVLMRALDRIGRTASEFDAVELIGEGRR